MKKSELVELIREIVREETRNILPEVLVEILKSKKVVAENRRPTQIVDAAHEREEKIYTKNPALNKILNQTRGGIPSEGSLTSLMNSNDFGKLGESTVVPSTDINGRPLDPENVPKHITEALTKDYSKFLKVMDKAAKAKRPV